MARTLRELSDRRPGLSQPQFSLRGLLWTMAGVCLVLALARYAGAAATAVGVVGLLSILAHMASTAIGGKLRGDQHRPTQSPDKSASTSATSIAGPDDVASRQSPIFQPLHAEPEDFVPATLLSRHKPLNRKPVIVVTVSGAVLGGAVGGGLLAFFMWGRLSIVNILFGAASAAVIGALFGFWAASFWQVVRQALKEAHSEP